MNKPGRPVVPPQARRLIKNGTYVTMAVYPQTRQNIRDQADKAGVPIIEYLDRKIKPVGGVK